MTSATNQVQQKQAHLHHLYARSIADILIFSSSTIFFSFLFFFFFFFLLQFMVCSFYKKIRLLTEFVFILVLIKWILMISVQLFTF